MEQLGMHVTFSFLSIIQQHFSYILILLSCKFTYTPPLTTMLITIVVCHTGLVSSGSLSVKYINIACLAVATGKLYVARIFMMPIT